MFKRIWQFFSGITYNVKIQGPSVKADSQKQLLCTIEIALPEECASGTSIKNPPEPTLTEFVQQDGTIADDIHKENRYEERQLNIDIFGTVTVPGKYTLQVKFPENSPITFKNCECQCNCKCYEIDVTPGLISKLRIVENSLKSTINPFEEQHLIVECLDTCGNICLPTENVQFKLELEDEAKNGLHHKCSGPRSRGIEFNYHFDRPGQFSVIIVKACKMKTMASQVFHGDYTCESFKVEVHPIFDCEESIVRNLTKELELPLFAEDSKHKSINIDIQVDLVSNRNIENIERLNLERLVLDVKVNDTVVRSSSPDVKILVPKIANQDSRKVICTFRNIEIPTGSNIVRIYHADQLIGQDLNVEVETVVQFDETNYIDPADQSTIRCPSSRVSIGEIIGADHYNLKNINRVLNKEKQEEIKDSNIREQDNFVLVKCETNAASNTVDRLLYLLLENIHYRKQARDFDSKREDWKNKGIEAWKNEKSSDANRCKSIKERYGKMLTECNTRASQAIFKFYNDNRPYNEIDLHGQLVANEGSLKSYEQQQIRKGDKLTIEVKREVERMRREQNEAIRHLEELWESFNHNKAREEGGGDWLEIIVGAGNNSDANIQKICPEVTKFINEKGKDYIVCNEGSLLVTFSEYQGEEPCMGTFFCKECRQSWDSAPSWKGKYQSCKRCKEKCTPFKLRPRLATNKKKTGQRFDPKEHMKGCEVCKQLGTYCGDAVRK